MNGRFQMQGGKNWFMPKEMNANRFFCDSHWLEIWSNHFNPSMGPNGGSVAMDSVLGQNSHTHFTQHFLNRLVSSRARPLSLQHQAASSQARLKSCWALPPCAGQGDLTPPAVVMQDCCWESTVLLICEVYPSLQGGKLTWLKNHLK
jgi:hypothetical protein